MKVINIFKSICNYLAIKFFRSHKLVMIAFPSSFIVLIFFLFITKEIKKKKKD